MKKLKNLKGAKLLNKKEQKHILGGSAVKCAQLFVSGNCCHPWWVSVCNHPYSPPSCVNGVCIN